MDQDLVDHDLEEERNSGARIARVLTSAPG
jgi:hypothetical protein